MTPEGRSPKRSPTLGPPLHPTQTLPQSPASMIAILPRAVSNVGLERLDRGVLTVNGNS